jgi:hypothetical protein
VLRVTLVDPDYLEPADRTVELLASRDIASLRDVLGGATLAASGRTARLALPAGAFRIVDVTLAPPGPPERSGDAPDEGGR